MRAGGAGGSNNTDKECGTRKSEGLLPLPSSSACKEWNKGIFLLFYCKNEGSSTHTLRDWGAKWHRQRNWGYRIWVCIQGTSFMFRAMLERPGMKSWGDYKVRWNHPKWNCCFPNIMPDEDPECLWTMQEKVKWGARKAAPDTKWKKKTKEKPTTFHSQ